MTAGHETPRSGESGSDLDRFVSAQEGVFERALRELHRGRKTSHWMWYIFPQIQGLGSSSTARRFAIRNRAEAEAYLAHPVLGPRLIACCEAVLAHPHRSATDIFGHPDDLKFRSCLTLFQAVDPENPVFTRALEAFYGGEPDRLTLEILGEGG